MLGVAALFVAVSMSSLPDEIFFSEMEFGACPAHRLTLGAVTYEPNGGTVYDADLTQFQNIWGRIAANDAPIAWPGANGSTPSIVNMPRDGYLAAAFHTPAETITSLGQYVYISFYPGPMIDSAISQQCGDFAAGLSSCLASGVSPQDQPFLHWRGDGSSSFWCVLQPDTDYYMNMRLSDPDEDAFSCGSTTCEVTASSNFGQ